MSSMSSMSAEEVSPTTRMKAADRRELILQAATAVFGAKTYVGTKEKLFIEVIQRAYDRLISEFRQALPGPVEGRGERMGTAYTGLLAERGMLAVIANSTALGGEPEIGRVA